MHKSILNGFNRKFKLAKIQLLYYSNRLKIKETIMSDYDEEILNALKYIQEMKRKQSETAIPSQAFHTYWLQSVSPSVKQNGFSSDDKSGKWCIFLSPKKVDEAWDKIKLAVESDKLSLAKVATKVSAEKFKKHVICVYTLDWSDKEELERTRQVLRELGFEKPLKYKRDLETINKVYGGKKEYFLTM